MDLKKKDKKLLLKLARNTIKSILEGKDLPKPDKYNLSPILKKKKATFVTLTKANKLRGCIGKILRQTQLYKDVMQNAENAAFFDPRFPPLSIEEFEEIKIEISVLTKPERLVYKNTKELLKILENNKPGVIIKSGLKSATFLPQVWEQLEDPKEFISSLCQKMGSSPELWKKKPLDIKTYEVIRFSES